MDLVEDWYDHKYEEWDRLERHRLEFDITKRYLEMYITGDKLKIFDIGGGPGRYSLFLAEKGHRVSLLDLSSKNIEVAKEKSKLLGIQLQDYIHGNALELGEYKQEYDVILLMGPLYHLIKESDRRLALSEALKLLKPGGIIFTAFISNYAPINDTLANLYQLEKADEVLRYLDNGINEDGQGFTSAYFTSYQEAMDLMGDYNLEQLVFAGVENILASKEREICTLDQHQYDKWLEVAFKLSTDKNLYGTGEHYLYIGKKL